METLTACQEALLAPLLVGCQMDSSISAPQLFWTARAYIAAMQGGRNIHGWQRIMGAASAHRLSEEERL